MSQEACPIDPDEVQPGDRIRIAYNEGGVETTKTLIVASIRKLGGGTVEFSAVEDSPFGRVLIDRNSLLNRCYDQTLELLPDPEEDRG